jgi:hypothetical protein
MRVSKKREKKIRRSRMEEMNRGLRRRKENTTGSRTRTRTTTRTREGRRGGMQIVNRK